MSETQEIRLAPSFKGPMVTVSLVLILMPILLNLLMLPRLLGLPPSLNRLLALGLLALPLLLSIAMAWLLRATLRDTRLILSGAGLEYHSPLLSLQADWAQVEGLIPSDSGSERWNLKLKTPAEILRQRLLTPPEAARLQIPLFPFSGTDIADLESRLKTYLPHLQRQH